MFSAAQFFIFAGLAISLTECQGSSLVPPAYQGVPATAFDAATLNGTSTDSSSISSAAHQVDQKSGAAADAPPDQPVTDTTVTALDGSIVNDTIPVAAASSRRSLPESNLRRRNNSNYELVFWGTGTGSNDRDAFIEGTAYLTYTIVSNATYDIDDCLAFCDSVEDCVFANLYYEYWNPSLDFVFPQQSNLKCILYADIHNASEKTNFGGQQLYPTPGPLNYIQQSSGWAVKSLVDPPTPSGYELIFGPTDGANNAPGYMGFAFLDRYDVDACAALCNERGADPVGGACQYFNIWRALVDGVPTTYTCSMYYLPVDESTAVNYGQSDLQVTESRGYKRKDVIVDGGFEGYTCPPDTGSIPFCFTSNYSNWQGSSPPGGSNDASIFDYVLYPRTGHSCALLGSAFNTDRLSGTLTPTVSLATQAGQSYTLQFFHSSVYAGPSAEASVSLEVVWNGKTIDTLHPGYQDWTPEQYTVVAQGNDNLQFIGGSAPAWIFLDDISLWEM